MSIRRHYKDGSVRARARSKKAASKWPKEVRTNGQPVLGGSPFGYFFEDCRFTPICTSLNPGGLPTGAIGTTGSMYFPGGLYGVYYFISAAGAFFGPRHGGTGKSIDLTIDAGAGEGLEYIWGAHPLAREGETSYAPGVTEDVFTRMVFESASPHLMGNIHFGWHNTDFDFEADWNNYTDLAALDMQGDTVDRGDVFISTITNDAATVSTATGYEIFNNVETEFKTVIKGGDCHFYINGQEYGPPFTLRSLGPSGAWLPFTRVQQAGVVSTCKMKELEIGTLKDISVGL